MLGGLRDSRGSVRARTKRCEKALDGTVAPDEKEEENGTTDQARYVLMMLSQNDVGFVVEREKGVRCRCCSRCLVKVRATIDDGTGIFEKKTQKKKMSAKAQADGATRTRAPLSKYEYGRML